MKIAGFLLFVAIATQTEAKKGGKHGQVDEFVSECRLCDWTDLESCSKSDEVETCADTSVCTTRYRLIGDGLLQVKKGCKNVNWALNQPQCEDTMNDNGEFVVGEPCLTICDEHMCNSQDMPVIKGPTSRSCYQCAYGTDSADCETTLCPMSEAACATQVKFTKTGEKLYQYLCHQQTYCQRNFVRKNHRNCGSSPAEASGVPTSRVCNYCTSDVDVDNSNPGM